MKGIGRLTRVDLRELWPHERWPQIQDAMIDAMVRLERAFKPEIQKLKFG